MKYSLVLLFLLASGCANIPTIVSNPVNDVKNTNNTSVSVNGKATHTETQSTGEGSDANSSENTAIPDPDLPDNNQSNPVPEGSESEERDDPI